ncbi:MAG TPA: hypothetical protein VMV57_08640 [Terracidiphilus sp.]|nr:hypothetical protein [Terracidiphilus sp.]
MKFLRQNDGNILILSSLSIMIMFGFVGLANDIGMVLWNKGNIQKAADCAAVAASAEMNYAAIDNTTIAAAAKKAAAQNGFTDGHDGVTVTVNNGPMSGPHAGNPQYVEVIVQRAVPTIFLRVFRMDTLSVGARAVSGFGGGQGCVFALGTSGTDIALSGGAIVESTKCQIFDNSSYSKALTVSTGASLSAKQIGIVGGYSANPSSISPTPVTGITAASDPLAYLQEPVVPSSCNGNLNLNGSSNYTLTPGCYSNVSYTGGGSLTFTPGLYIITGNLNLNGSGVVTGNAVTFYITGSVSATNGILKLSAPTSGTHNGILLFQSRSNSTNISFSGGGSSVLEGIFYAPAANLSFTGSNSGAQYYISLVAKSVSFSGQSSLENYSLINGTSPIGAAKLVE